MRAQMQDGDEVDPPEDGELPGPAPPPPPPPPPSTVSSTSLFLEPVAWMAAVVVGAVQGKLNCPSCNARLGSFNWSGACV